MEQTKGYFRLEGKIWGLNNKQPFTNSLKRSLPIGIQSSKTNSNYVQVGDWINSKLNVKIKAEADGEVLELGEQDAIDFIKENFKDGDSVYLNLRADVDTFHKRLNYIVGNIYKKSEEIDFNSESFEEVNELNQVVIITEKPNDDRVKVGVTTFKGEMLELDLALEDEVVKEYMIENSKVGDLMHLTLLVDNRPIYEEVTANSEPSKERTTLKGKKLGGNNSNGYKKIKDRQLVISIVDVDTDKNEKSKYTRDEIREALDLAESKSKNKTNQETTTIGDDDLPF